MEGYFMYTKNKTKSIFLQQTFGRSVFNYIKIMNITETVKLFTMVYYAVYLVYVCAIPSSIQFTIK